MKKAPKKNVKKSNAKIPKKKKSFRKWYLLLAIAIFAILTLWIYFFDTHNLRIETPNGVVALKVERALTPAQQQKGLMFRNSLGPKEGMIFLFSKNRIAHMWMKNTLIPLDMIFFDKEGRVVSIYNNARPLDLKLISSVIPVAGVLEINAGAAKAFGIDVHSRINLEAIK